jgi:hypothetical protein
MRLRFGAFGRIKLHSDGKYHIAFETSLKKTGSQRLSLG